MKRRYHNHLSREGVSCAARSDGFLPSGQSCGNHGFDVLTGAGGRKVKGTLFYCVKHGPENVNPLDAWATMRTNGSTDRIEVDNLPYGNVQRNAVHWLYVLPGTTGYWCWCCCRWSGGRLCCPGALLASIPGARCCLAVLVLLLCSWRGCGNVGTLEKVLEIIANVRG